MQGFSLNQLSMRLEKWGDYDGDGTAYLVTGGTLLRFLNDLKYIGFEPHKRRWHISM